MPTNDTQARSDAQPQPWLSRVRSQESFDGLPVAQSESARERWAYSWQLARMGLEHEWPGMYNDVAAEALGERGEVDPLDDSYDALLTSCTRDCFCQGWDVPCGGVTAGGVCDRVTFDEDRECL